MARRRHTPEQIVRKLREADRLLAEGAEVADVARHLEVSERTYHRWRNQYGAIKADDVKRLRELERENARLKQIVADKELENLALRGRCQMACVRGPGLFPEGRTHCGYGQGRSGARGASPATTGDRGFVEGVGRAR